MIEEITYTPEELTHGVCTSCGEESDEILKGDGRCIDCIAADDFYEMTISRNEEDDFRYF